MAFTKEIPQWENAGQKPPQSKITEGFKPLDHPPADWFNWFMNGTSEAVQELQNEAATTSEVTAALKVLSNDIETHSNAKNNPHAVTKSQVGLGNVDNIKQASKADFDSHVSDKKIHVTEEKQELWNNSQLYKLTTDSGFRQAVPNTIGGTNLFELPPGYYYGAGQYFTNLPTTNDTSWFNVDVFTTGIRKNFHVIRSADNTHWFGTIHTDGSFKGWKRILTDADTKLNWKFPTIENGWKTYKSEVNNDYRVRVAKDAMGIVHITGAIAGGTLGDVHAFMLPEGCEPPFPLYNVGIASSTGGFKGPQVSRQYIATDGRFCIQDTTSNVEFIVVNCVFKAKE